MQMRALMNYGPLRKMRGWWFLPSDALQPGTCIECVARNSLAQHKRPVSASQ